MSDFKDYTIFIRNFDSKQVTHDLLLELFTQAGPVQNLTFKDDFAFLEFEDKESVLYACNLLNETELYGIPLQVKPRNGSRWENVELYKFPKKHNYDDIDSRAGNNNYNDYRQNSRSNTNYIESDFRPSHRSSFPENDFIVNNRAGNYYEEEYRTNTRPSQINNFNDMSNNQSHNSQHVNRSFSNNSDYNWQNSNRFSLNNVNQDLNRLVDNQQFYSNSKYQKQSSANESYSYSYSNNNSNNRGTNNNNFPQDRHQLSTESLWRDRGANNHTGWAENGPATNKTYGNYRNRPY